MNAASNSQLVVESHMKILIIFILMDVSKKLRPQLKKISPGLQVFLFKKIKLTPLLVNKPFNFVRNCIAESPNVVYQNRFN